MRNNEPCGQTIHQLRARDFRSWRGLDERCTPDAFAAALGREGSNEGMRPLGSEAVEVTWWPAPCPGYGEPLEVQLAEGRVVRIDGLRPSLDGGLPALLAALGEPAAKLAYHDNVVPIPDGEWVWPGRGLALYLSADHRFVRRVALFHATDLDRYLRRLRPNLRVYEER